MKRKNRNRLTIDRSLSPRSRIRTRELPTEEETAQHRKTTATKHPSLSSPLSLQRRPPTTPPGTSVLSNKKDLPSRRLSLGKRPEADAQEVNLQPRKEQRKAKKAKYFRDATKRYRQLPRLQPLFPRLEVTRNPHPGLLSVQSRTGGYAE